ncbi:hypothetical protein B0H11DRAFT_2304089 [Mycena galericulata]|nr:hypothetical protein B0H11DRAFT_2304089 [Mycena galericulata]
MDRSAGQAAQACGNCGFTARSLGNPPFPLQEFPHSPPPIHLSSTNDVPSNAEAFQSRREIREARVLLSKVAIEIKGLAQKALERRHLYHHIEQHRVVLLPLRGFPPEIMNQIFLWARPESGVMIPPSNRQSPWNLSHVCSRWRAIALSIPALWCNILMTNNRWTAHTRDTLHAQLKRSASCLLEISLISNNTPALTVLLDHSSRLRMIQIAYFSAETKKLLDRISGRLPELRTLSLSWVNTFAAYGVCRVFETAPKLSEVILTGPYRTSPLSLPFGHLTRLRIGTYAASCLASARNLRELTLDFCFRDETRSLVELPVLRMLRVQSGSFLASFALPALEDLFLDHDCEELISMIHRSGCQLRKLGLKYCSTEQGLAILDSIPSLSDLWWPPYSATLSRMIIPTTPAPGFHPVAPKLRSMTLIQLCALDEDTPSILVKLMESRQRNAAFPIQTLSLRILDYDYSWQTATTSLQMEAELRRQGMDVEYLFREYSKRKFDEHMKTYP